MLKADSIIKLGLFGVPFFDYWTGFNIFGYNVLLGDLYFCLLIICSFLTLVVRKSISICGTKKTINSNFILFYIFFFVTLTSSLLVGSNVNSVLKTAFHLLFYVVSIHLFLVSGEFKPLEIKKIIEALFKLSIIVLLYGVYQAFAHTFDLPFKKLTFLKFGYENTINYENYSTLFKTIGGSGVVRISSVFAEPSWFGIYLTILFSFIFVYLQFERKNRYIVFYVLLMSICLLLSTSLSSFIYVSIVFGFLIYKTFIHNKKIFNLKLIFIVSAFGIFSLIILPKDLVGALICKISSPGSDQERYLNLMAGLEAFKDCPVFGIGWGNYHLYLHKILPHKDYADSFYMQVLAETGLFGFSLFIIFILFMFKRVPKKIGMGKAYFYVIVPLFTVYLINIQTAKFINPLFWLFYLTIIYIFILADNMDDCRYGGVTHKKWSP